jgi:hypothetical protein
LPHGIPPAAHDRQREAPRLSCCSGFSRTLQLLFQSRPAAANARKYRAINGFCRFAFRLADAGRIE